MTMRQTPKAGKLEALRLQTDRQLVTLINKQLERGFRVVNRRDRGSAECYKEVTQACSEIGRLLPVVESITRAERSRIESRLSELQGMLAFAGMPAAS